MSLAGRSLAHFGHKKLITPPAQAVAAGYTRLYFNSDFDSPDEIDMTNSGAPGFKWYPRNAWTNCTDNLPNNWRVFQPFNTANLSFANSVMTVHDNNFAATGGCELMTACDNLAGGYTGFVAPIGWYIECSMKWDVGNHVGQAIAFWVDPIEFMLGQVVDFVEVDIHESFGDGGGSGHGIVLNWHYFANPATQASERTAAGAGYYEYMNAKPTPIEDNTAFHSFGCLWKPISLFGSPGKYHFYVDDVERSREWPWGAGPVQYSTAGQDYGKGEGQHMVPIIYSGNGQVVHYDWVRVWGRP